MDRICKDCGSVFTITDGELNFYKDRGLQIPKRCGECRGERKKSNNKDKKNIEINVKVKTILLVCLAIFAISTLFFSKTDENKIADDTQATLVDATSQRYQFRTEEYLVEHFEKHGNEFDYATKEEYLIGANNVISSNNTMHKEEAEDGDEIYYNADTNEFVIVAKDGYLRTYFKPEDGIEYFNRQ